MATINSFIEECKRQLLDLSLNENRAVKLHIAHKVLVILTEKSYLIASAVILDYGL
jgi:hypothetical protein